MNRTKERLILEEERGNIPEELLEKVVPPSAMQRFRLLFLNNNKNRTIQKVEVKNLNFQDLMRHLHRGESVYITPKLLGDSSKETKKQEDRSPWYFAHL
jgi:hypothetical protein